ncbi:hypothetical protein HK405_008984, partial [Cladochytrium tenue]
WRQQQQRQQQRQQQEQPALDRRGVARAVGELDLGAAERLRGQLAHISEALGDVTADGGGAAPARSTASGDDWHGGRRAGDGENEEGGGVGSGGVEYSGLFRANRHCQSDLSTVAGLKRVEDAYADLLEDVSDSIDDARIEYHASILRAVKSLDGWLADRAAALKRDHLRDVDRLRAAFCAHAADLTALVSARAKKDGAKEIAKAVGDAEREARTVLEAVHAAKKEALKKSHEISKLRAQVARYQLLLRKKGVSEAEVVTKLEDERLQAEDMLEHLQTTVLQRQRTLREVLADIRTLEHILNGGGGALSIGRSLAGSVDGVAFLDDGDVDLAATATHPGGNASTRLSVATRSRGVSLAAGGSAVASARGARRPPAGSRVASAAGIPAASIVATSGDGADGNGGGTVEEEEDAAAAAAELTEEERLDAEDRVRGRLESQLAGGRRRLLAQAEAERADARRLAAEFRGRYAELLEDAARRRQQQLQPQYETPPSGGGGGGDARAVGRALVEGVRVAGAAARRVFRYSPSTLLPGRRDAAAQCDLEASLGA